MKKIISKIFVVLFTIMFIANVFVIIENKTAKASDTGLIAFWSFDNQNNPLYDDSGNGHDGTNFGASWTSNGVSGGALKFDGVNDYVEVVKYQDFEFGQDDDFTINFWRKDNDNGAADYIACSQDHNAGQYSGWGIHNAIYPKSGDHWGEGVGLFITESPNSVTTLSGALDDDWHMITLTKSGSQLMLYTDTLIIDSGTISTPYYVDHNFIIGANVNDGYMDPDVFFNGVMDEIRIYNRALSTDEIISLYEQDTSSKLPNELIAYWSFDDSSNPAYDDSGNGHDGINNGASWTSNGKCGGAMEFNGINDYILVNNVSGSSEVTYSAWIKAYGPNSNSVCEAQTVLFHSTGFGGTTNKGKSCGLLALWQQHYDPQEIWFGIYSDKYEADWLNEPFEFFDNEYHHLAATFSDNTLKIYIDGNLVASKTSTISSISTNTYPVYIGDADQGSCRSGMDAAFNGIIDELRIYNYELSASEIAVLYEECKPVPKDYYVAFIDTYPGNISVAKIGYPGNWVNDFEIINITPDKYRGKCGNCDVTSDGKKIVFGYKNSTNWDILIGDLNYDDSTIENVLSIANSDKREEDPKFSWDNKLVVYKNMTMATSDSDIFTYNISSGKTEIINDSKFEDSIPFFSPNGKSIIFTRRETTGDKTSDEIYKYDYPDNVKNITNSSVSSWYAVFVKNDKIIFIRNDDLYLYNTITKQEPVLIYSSSSPSDSDVDPYPLKDNTDFIVFLTGEKPPYDLNVLNYMEDTSNHEKLSNGVNILGPCAFIPEKDFSPKTEEKEEEEQEEEDEPPTQSDDESEPVTPGFELIILIGAIALIIIFKRRKSY